MVDTSAASSSLASFVPAPVVRPATARLSRLADRQEARQERAQARRVFEGLGARLQLAHLDEDTR